MAHTSALHAVPGLSLSRLSRRRSTNSCRCRRPPPSRTIHGYRSSKQKGEGNLNKQNGMCGQAASPLLRVRIGRVRRGVAIPLQGRSPAAVVAAMIAVTVAITITTVAMAILRMRVVARIVTSVGASRVGMRVRIRRRVVGGGTTLHSRAGWRIADAFDGGKGGDVGGRGRLALDGWQRGDVGRRAADDQGISEVYKRRVERRSVHVELAPLVRSVVVRGTSLRSWRLRRRGGGLDGSLRQLLMPVCREGGSA